MVQASVPPVPPWVPVETLTVLAAVTASFLVVVLSSDKTDYILARFRRRLIMGVPWGTLISIVAVILVYLFLQGGINEPRDPLVIPFRSWSYYYPLGMLTAAFSHSSLNHVTGNLVATAMFGPIVEYAWGHYPRSRGSQSFSTALSNPFVRVLVVPAAIFVVGLFTAAFALGPVVGFSGVVFALAGFALVQKPILAALAILANRVVRLVVTAIQNPEVVAVPRPRIITPWWTNIAIQGHAIGVLSGLLLGLGLLYYRDRRPEPGKIWFGLLAFATIQGLWALFLPQGNGRFILFRWIGTALVFVLAAVIVVAAIGEYEFDLAPRDTLAALGESKAEFRILGTSSVFSTGALVIVVALTAALSGAAIPYNVAPIGQADAPEPSVEVRDYSISYGEDVPDGYVNSVTVPGFDDTTAVNTSGVIVTSERRHVWQTVLLESQLKNRGFATVTVGGVGWRHNVHINQTGWKPAGNQSVYKVYLRLDGEDRILGFSTESSRATPIIGGRNVTVSPANEGFEFVVSRDGESMGNASVPSQNRTTAAGGITFVRNESQIVAVDNETRVPIATRTGSGNY